MNYQVQFLWSRRVYIYPTNVAAFLIWYFGRGGARSPTGTIEPGPGGNYLPDKFERWKAWFATILVG